MQHFYTTALAASAIVKVEKSSPPLQNTTLVKQADKAPVSLKQASGCESLFWEGRRLFFFPCLFP